MTNSIALVPLGDLERMGIALAKSGLFGMKSPEQAIALMLVAQAEGQHPATIAQDYDIIQGKATRKTHSVMARFQAAGGKVEWHELTDQKADATFSHAQGGSLRMVWTFEQARRSGLTNKDNWKNYPRAMLRARCIAEGVRAVYPAAIGGMLVAEEAQDMQAPPKHMGAAVTTDVAPASQSLIDKASEAAAAGVAAYSAFWSVITKAERQALADMHNDNKRRAEEADKARTVDAPVDEFIEQLDASEVAP